jgi:hypothetical protein
MEPANFTSGGPRADLVGLLSEVPMWGPFGVHKLGLRRHKPSIGVTDFQPFLTSR